MKNIIKSLDKLKQIEYLDSIENIAYIIKEILLETYNLNMEALVFYSTKTDKTRVWYKDSFLDDKTILANSTSVINNVMPLKIKNKYFVPLHAMNICFGSIMISPIDSSRHPYNINKHSNNAYSKDINIVLENYGDEINILISYFSLLLYSEKLSFEANTDRLTKIYNRGYILDYISSIQNKGKPYSIVIMDIDKFKHYNDRYGHNIGDHILKRFAAVIKSALGEEGTKEYKFARYGGEEFIIVIPSDAKDIVIKTMDTIRNVILATNFSTDEYSLKVTVSMGASVSKVGKDIYDTIEEADKALYIAKESGRNRYIFFDISVD